MQQVVGNSANIGYTGELARHVVVPGFIDVTAQSKKHSERGVFKVELAWATFNVTTANKCGCEVAATQTVLGTDRIELFGTEQRIIAIQCVRDEESA